MNKIIKFPTHRAVSAIPAADKRLSHDYMARIEDIRDNVETLLDIVACIRHGLLAVAYAAASGNMRIFHLHGLASTIGFANRRIETAEIATDLSQP